MDAKQILLVEDNPVNRRLVEFLLKSKGYEVWWSSSAPEAFKLLKEKHPDLILMDIQLPEMDGLTATKHLKADPETRDIPVIAVTSYAMKGDEDKARDAGCNGYIAKPLDNTVFLEMVAKTLGEQPAKQP
jgi:two-component system, cell cycle response regulator DivK